MNKFIEKIVNANDFKDLNTFKDHMYKQFEKDKENILKIDNEEFNIGLDDFKPEFEIRYDYLDKNDIKKRWIYVIKMHECSFNRSFMNGDRACTYTYHIAPDLKALFTKGYGSISNGATNRIYKNYTFKVNYETNTTEIELKHLNLTEAMLAKEKGEEYKSIKIEYTYQGTNLYEIVNEITEKLSKM